MKEYVVRAYTQRKMILNEGHIKALNEDEARIYVYSYIIKHKERLGFNDKLYLKIELTEWK